MRGGARHRAADGVLEVRLALCRHGLGHLLVIQLIVHWQLAHVPPSLGPSTHIRASGAELGLRIADPPFSRVRATRRGADGYPRPARLLLNSGSGDVPLLTESPCAPRARIFT